MDAIPKEADIRNLLQRLRNLVAIIACAAIFSYASPARSQISTAQPCISIELDINGLETTFVNLKAVGKFWLWDGEGYFVSFVISSLDPNVVILTTYDAAGCRSVHAGTKLIRTPMPITERIIGYILRSKLRWKNTDQIFLTDIRRGL